MVEVVAEVAVEVAVLLVVTLGATEEKGEGETSPWSGPG